MKQKQLLIELWKENCSDCEAAKPIIKQLEKEGYLFEKYNIESEVGRSLWEEYLLGIDENSTKLGYETGYIYTPTFINPNIRKVLAYTDRAPTKEELIELAREGSA